ncbi:hypothetical protein [Flavobacterium sp.]|uniref:hypothetical protein n=3 Tax=Flavobacterium sp. TaxID=239 RepID=UPI00404716DA
MNTSNKTNPKKMPHSCTKSQLYDMYCLDMSRRQIRNGINTIIKENRGLPKFHNVRLIQIAPKELKEFIETYGLPRNYEL